MSVDCSSLKTRQLMRVITRLYDAELTKCGIKTTQYTLLRHVRRFERLNVTELAEKIRIDTSTLSRNLRPLVAMRAIEITQGDDQRSRRVVLTEAGQELLVQASEHWENAQAILLSKLGKPRVALLHRLVDEILDVLDNDGSAGL